VNMAENLERDFMNTISEAHIVTNV